MLLVLWIVAIFFDDLAAFLSVLNDDQSVHRHFVKPLVHPSLQAHEIVSELKGLSS